MELVYVWGHESEKINVRDECSKRRLLCMHCAEGVLHLNDALMGQCHDGSS